VGGITSGVQLACNPLELLQSLLLYTAPYCQNWQTNPRIVFGKDRTPLITVERANGAAFGSYTKEHGGPGRS
jgi:hypothetical protein